MAFHPDDINGKFKNFYESKGRVAQRWVLGGIFLAGFAVGIVVHAVLF